jgi:hypothetical protein
MLGVARQAGLGQDVLAPCRHAGSAARFALPEPDAWIGCRLPSLTGHPL